MIRRYGKSIFLITAAAVVAVFLVVSTGLVRDLSVQERSRMEIWADATREIVASFDSDHPVNIDFLLRIIESNTTIPVLLTDSEGNILQHRNFDLPEPVDSLNPGWLSDSNREFLEGKLASLAAGTNVIDITIAPGVEQHLYYEDSTLLKRLSFYPYVVIAVMIAFVMVVYFAMLSTKRAEQNKVWVGLSKETAHQLGTPISSLMAWMELLPEMGVDEATVSEMNKDVNRLSTIASRFSKIGSVPQLSSVDLNDVVEAAARYMSSRISNRITLDFVPAPQPVRVMLTPPLFEWVMENLIKNAVDATEGRGTITVTVGRDHSLAYVDVSDTGKGMSRKMFKRVFNPGFTTKKRGWGLGLTLARRIIADYHRGTIFVKSSTPGAGTTFRVTLEAIG
ncbi:MAG: HAMP domain-containing histidine kinase [Muribaculaceae bacterium]|nr:HAMP domain-containing histidine kinase [Muribaculaceae bacterium]